MTLVALALAITTRVQDPETVVFRDELLNVSFSHPKDWKVAKRDKRSVTFEIPLGNDKGTLELVRTAFRSEPDIWQTIQLRTNELSKNKVVRQWEQTVLDAPMLFTQTELSEKGRSVTRLTGLFYTKTPLKLLFNLDVPTSTFSDVQATFNRLLETVRTIDGTSFTAENPDAPAPPTKPVPVAPRNTVDDGKGKPSPGAKLKNQVEAPVGPLKTVVRFRDDWSGSLGEQGITLTSKRIGGPFSVEPGTALDTSPSNLLKTRAGESLARYARVARREDHEAARNAAGALVTSVWRRGDGASGALQTLDAVIVNGDLYVAVRYVGTDLKRFDSERDAINDLLDHITIEPAP